VTLVAADTSAAVPYLMRSHESHHAVRRALSQYRLVLTGHSLAETYSVLTRLPGDARVAPADAVALIDANFGRPVLPSEETTVSLLAEMARHGIAGGAVYDAMVGLAARDARLGLVTRDRRAATTYSTLGLELVLLPA
jgi:toxin FitB